MCSSLPDAFRRKLVRGDKKFWIDDLEDHTANTDFPLSPRQSAGIDHQSEGGKQLSNSADDTHEKD